MHTTAEKLGPGFKPALYLEAQAVARALTHELASKMEVGMLEDDAHAVFKDMLRARGITKLWHPTKIRFAQNTLCTFRAVSEPGVKLQTGELFSLDIGTVVENHEGDYGETFKLGGGEDPLISGSREVFTEVEAAWLKDKLTGRALYEVAKVSAQKRGFELNLSMDGHRLGDFPHVLFHRGDLGEFSHVPSPGLWILEILIADSKRQRGAFFEDLLGSFTEHAS